MSELSTALGPILQADPPRAGSLAISVFGDVISAQGGSVWLASLVAAMGEFGLNPQQVRTAMFRLAQDGWLVSEQRGRASYYQFSDAGQHQFRRAAARIYTAAAPAWDGQWTFVMDTGPADATRDELRRQLNWIGCGQLGTNLLAHPRADLAAVREIVSEAGADSRVVIWRAEADDELKLHNWVRDAWDLDDLEQRYTRFERRFEPLLPLVQNGAAPRDAFLLRALMVHEYRRILLKTTELPPALLSPDWAGHRAHKLLARLYREIHVAASTHASAVLKNADGPLPAPDAAFYRRLGGLAGAPVEHDLA